MWNVRHRLGRQPVTFCKATAVNENKVIEQDNKQPVHKPEHLQDVPAESINIFYTTTIEIRLMPEIHLPLPIRLIQNIHKSPNRQERVQTRQGLRVLQPMPNARPHELPLPQTHGQNIVSIPNYHKVYY